MQADGRPLRDRIAIDHQSCPPVFFGVETMKVTIEFDLEIDGELSEERAKELFLQNLNEDDLTSEQVDGTGDWAILINGWELKE